MKTATPKISLTVVSPAEFLGASDPTSGFDAESYASATDAEIETSLADYARAIREDGGISVPGLREFLFGLRASA